LEEYDRNGSLAVGPRSVASLQGWFSIRRKGKRSQWRQQSRLFKMFPARPQGCEDVEAYPNAVH
jgi:hypothetical protein